MKGIFTAVVVLAASASIAAAFTCENIETSGWETFDLCEMGEGIYEIDTPFYPTDLTEPILGHYGNLCWAVVGDRVRTGDRALRLTDLSDSGPATPEAYVGWVTGLEDGDEVTAGVWIYDDTPGAAPSGRLWGQYTSGGIANRAGDAGGDSDSGDGSGWYYHEYTWTFDSDGGARDGLAIEILTYDSNNDTIWVDDLTITAPCHTAIAKPEVPEPATMGLLAIGALGLIGKRR